jgi:hypothetical protein
MNFTQSRRRADDSFAKIVEKLGKALRCGHGRA